MIVVHAKSLLRVVLVDTNPRVVQAWQGAFAENPEVEIVRGSILHQDVDAWVTPTNARGRMDGGVDAVIKRHLGACIQNRVQREIAHQHGGLMPVGYATCVPAGTDRPRYLMGTGTPEDLLTLVGMGYDLFDCVLPTRNGRNGMLFTSRGKLNIRNAGFARDGSPPDPDCECPVCSRYSRAYLRHLAASGEILSPVLNSVHNLAFYLRLMRDARAALEQGRFPEYAQGILGRLSAGTETS